MSFGFSVGDFLTVATVAWKLSTTLRSAKGASASYHNLICELESTAQSVYHAGQQLETAGLPASPANCISHGLSQCHSNLRLLDVIVKKYAKSMQTAKGKERDWWGVKTGLKKISWEMCEREGVDEIRQNIRTGVVQIMLILEACGLNAMGRMESKINAMGRMESKINAMERIESKILETFAVVKRVEAAIPQSLGAWPCDHKVIYLDDALGRLIPISLEFCGPWEVFYDTLKLAFRGKPGSSWIEAEQFKLTTLDNQQVLPAKWESFAKPSTTLLMSMVLQKHGKSWENLPISCPLCKSESQRKSGQIQCTKCFISYSVSDINSVQDIQYKAADFYGNPDNPLKPQMQQNIISAQEEDIKSFKRLELVQVTRSVRIHLSPGDVIAF